LKEAATLYGRQGFDAISAAKQLPPQAAAQAAAARGKAREAFAKATAVTDRAIEICTKELAALPKAVAIQADPKAKERRDQLRNRQLEARFLRAQLGFEQALTFDEKSNQRAAALEAASALFGQINEEFRGSVAGDASRYYQGRCAQEVEAYEKALTIFTSLTNSIPTKPEFRIWAARAVRRKAECFIAIGKLDEAITSCQEWLAASQPAERQQSEWLEVSYQLAIAMQAKLKDGQAKPAEASRYQAESRKLLREVSQRPNDFQQEAKAALASAGRGKAAAAEPKNFDEAFAAGEEAIGLMNSSGVAAKLARENNPEAVEELQQQAAESREEALRVLKLALDMADRQTPIDKLNRVRYYLSVLLLDDKKTFDAAVLAETIATKYPENEFAPSAAKVALAAYEQLANEARTKQDGKQPPNGAGDYETTKLMEIAQLMATRWPKAPEAAAAATLLIQNALRDDRVADAEAIVEKLPAESRGPAQLTLGAGLWSQYLRTTAGQREAPSESAIALRDKAGSLLNAGFQVARKGGELTASSAAGVLYLVQYLLATGDAKTAQSVLEDKEAGPLALVKEKASAATNPFILESYKTALRTYLSVEPPERKKASAMMKSLDDFVSAQGGDSADQQLTEMYRSLGFQLQRQMKELNAGGQQDKAKQVAAAFGDVLDRVAKRPDADTWRIRVWLAQMNLQLGQALEGKEADEYIDRAQKEYQAVLKTAEKDKKYAPDEISILGVRMRLAECLASRGQYDKSIEQYAEILRTKPNMLDLQQAAASAFQEWGVAAKNPEAFNKAIRGDLPQKDGKNLIWGWNRISIVADAAQRKAPGDNKPLTPEEQERVARFEDIFFDARYNIARARYLAGTVTEGDMRQQELDAAKKNVEQMIRLYPDLGGPKWKAAFEELLKQVNQELNKK
jgi:tetratricopeptide (TPR) repeat protein